MESPKTIPRLTPDLRGFRTYVEAVGDYRSRAALARFTRILIAQGSLVPESVEQKAHEEAPSS